MFLTIRETWAPAAGEVVLLDSYPPCRATVLELLAGGLARVLLAGGLARVLLAPQSRPVTLPVACLRPLEEVQ